MVRCQKLFGHLQCDSDAEHLREYFKCIDMSAGFWGLLFKYDESSSKPVSFTFFRANHKSYFEKSYFFFVHTIKVNGIQKNIAHCEMSVKIGHS